MVMIATDIGFVSQDHARIAEIIAEYDPNLRLAFIPEGKRNPDDPNEKPFAVLDMGNGQREPHVIFHADTCDERIIARVIEADQRVSDLNTRFAAEEAARQLVDMKKQIERFEHAEDVARTMRRRSFS
jgi:hypothetical protein